MYMKSIVSLDIIILISILDHNNHIKGSEVLDKKEFFLEIWRIWVSRRLSNWTATIFIISGISSLSPAWWYGLANSVYSSITNSSMTPFEESPITGWVFIVIGLFLVAMSIWERKSTRNKEVIAIRHKSLGNFLKEALKPDLPFVQRLWFYREIDVDHTDSYENGVLVDHQSVVRRINKVPSELDGILNTNTDTPIAYYGLTHIPLAFYLGYLLSDNKYHVQLYDLNNDSGKWDQLNGIDTLLGLTTDYDNLPNSTEQGDIILSIGISYPVHLFEIDELKITDEIGRVNIEVPNPQRQLISSQIQIEQVCSEFKAALERIKNTCPNRQKVHLFYSGPVSLAFALGRCVSERIDSEILVYNYSVKEQPKYNWCLSLNSTSSAPAIISHQADKGEQNASV